MNLLLVSTCGTSALTNRAPPEIGTILRRVSNSTNIAEPDLSKITTHVEQRRRQLLDSESADARSLSAEINGIDAALAISAARTVTHLLVHSDTQLGRWTAEAVAAWLLAKRGHVAQLLTVGGLRTDDAAGLRAALSELTVHLEQWTGTRGPHNRVVFNLTGGFKSVNGYLQALGMLLADETVYLFEGSPELMRIPRLPVQVDLEGAIETASRVFRRIAMGYAVGPADTVGMPESLFDVVGDAVTGSVWGDAGWRKHRAAVLAKAPLASLSPRLRWTEAFERHVRGLEAKRRVEVQETLDALAASFDGARPLLKSDTMKRLAGNPTPPSTHEVYAWSDGDAARLFGHFEASGDFVVDTLGPHL